VRGAAGFDSEDPATDIDPMILANLSSGRATRPWPLRYRSAHGHFVRHRRRWSSRRSGLTRSCGGFRRRPASRESAFERLDHLRAYGPSAQAFDFKTRFPARKPARGARR